MSVPSLTAEAINAEFELATHGLDFSSEDYGDEMRLLLYTYFAAGALWAQAELVPEEVWVPRSKAELEQAKAKLLNGGKNMN